MPSVPGAATLALVVCLGAAAPAKAAEAMPGSVALPEECRTQCSNFDLASLTNRLQEVQASAMNATVNQDISAQHAGSLIQNIGSSIQGIGNAMQNIGPRFDKLMTDVVGFVCEHQAAFECVHRHQDACLQNSSSSSHAGVNPTHVLKLATSGVGCMCNACPSLVPGFARFQASLIQGFAMRFFGDAGQGAAQAALMEGTCSLYQGLRCIRTSTACAGIDPFDGQADLFINGTSPSVVAEDPEQLKAMCDAQGISTDIASDLKPDSTRLHLAAAFRASGWPGVVFLGAVSFALW